MCHQKKLLFVSCIYKDVRDNKKNSYKCDLETINSPDDSQ